MIFYIEHNTLINYFQPMDIVFDEVYKRTSMIGKFSYSQEGQNLLDRIALTPDERLIFNSFFEEAENDIFKAMYPYLDKMIPKAYYDSRTTVVKYENGAIYSVGDLVDYTSTGAALSGTYAILKDADDTANIADTSTFIQIEDKYGENTTHFIVRREGWVDPQAIRNVDSLILDCFCIYIMYKWFVLCAPDKVDYYYSDYQDKRRSLRMLLSQHNTMEVVSHPF